MREKTGLCLISSNEEWQECLSDYDWICAVENAVIGYRGKNIC